jgi:hypothetical protein
MRSTFWIPKATDTHAEYVIIIIALSLWQWFCEGISLLRYTHIVYLVKILATSRKPAIAGIFFECYQITGLNFLHHMWLPVSK